MKPLLLFISCCVVAGCTFRAVATPSATGQPQPLNQPQPAPYTPPPPQPAVVHRTPSEPVAPASTTWRAPPSTAPVVAAPAPAPVVAPPPPPAAAPYPDDRQDRRRDRKFDRNSDWDKLGERWVDGSVDRDAIAVGRNDGAYVALSIVAEHAPIEIFDIVVEFTDGTAFAPNLRYAFRPGDTNHVIDLPGGQRWLRRITFRYGNLPGNGRAQVELWGLDARRDAGDGRDGGHPGRGRGRGKNR